MKPIFIFLFIYLATLYTVNINALPHRRLNDEFENDDFVSCNPNIFQELNVSFTPNPLVSDTVATFEVAGRLLIDAPRKFNLDIIVNTDTLELHDQSPVEPTKLLKAGDLFNFFENLTMPTLSEHYTIEVSLNSLDVTLACVNKTI